MVGLTHNVLRAGWAGFTSLPLAILGVDPSGCALPFLLQFRLDKTAF